MKQILILCILLFIVACAPIHLKSGKAFTIDQIQLIEKDKTKKEAINRLFGDPQLLGKNDRGLDTWTYLYMDAKIPLRGGQIKEKVQRVTITFEDGTVKSFSYELSR
ncbi:MAG: hypothetical protein IME96_09515 [Proteobacteria bacterium]|nr:hypothetical protein [Pseudomonadota bacterium]